MSDQQQLEQELARLWQRAANTRKATSQKRIERIMENSRAELSLRDLLGFAGHLSNAFFHLFTATHHAALPSANKTIKRPIQPTTPKPE